MGLYVNEKQLLEKALTPSDVQLLNKVVTENLPLYKEDQLVNKLTKIYSSGVFGGTMPYTVQTAETQTPDEWLEDRMAQVYLSVKK